MSYNPQFVKIATMRALNKVAKPIQSRKKKKQDNSSSSETSVSKEVKDILARGTETGAKKGVQAASLSAHPYTALGGKILPAAKKAIPMASTALESAQWAATGKNPVTDYDYDKSGIVDAILDATDVTNPYAMARTATRSVKVQAEAAKKRDDLVRASALNPVASPILKSQYDALIPPGQRL